MCSVQYCNEYVVYYTGRVYTVYCIVYSVQLYITLCFDNENSTASSKGKLWANIAGSVVESSQSRTERTRVHTVQLVHAQHVTSREERKRERDSSTQWEVSKCDQINICVCTCVCVCVCVSVCAWQNKGTMEGVEPPHSCVCVCVGQCKGEREEREIEREGGGERGNQQDLKSRKVGSTRHGAKWNCH